MPRRLVMILSIRTIAAALGVALALPALASAADATLFRIFLVDGTALVSYGEYARVNDQVIFSMPVSGSSDQPRLQVVTLGASSIDWPRTERDAVSTRYQQYATTRGEQDFQLLSNEVARVLNDIALSTDRPQALAMAEQARRTLADWPQAHFGYRQDDVREIVTLIDEAIGRLRGTASAGFELSLVSSVPEFALDPPPTLPSSREAVEHLLKLTELTPGAADRMALLQSALAAVKEPTAIGTVEATALRLSIEARIQQEVAVDGKYNDLSQRLVAAASRAAARAKVTDVERLLAQIPREDARLGSQRPEMVESLRAELGAQLDAARRLRLLRDQWVIRRSLYREYQKTIESQVVQLVKSQSALEAIRRLDGPSPERLMALRSRLSGGAERLERLQVIADLRSTHELLVTAWRFAEKAADARYAAISSGDVSVAWEASSAAAGSMLMLSRAQHEIRTRLELPRLQ